MGGWNRCFPNPVNVFVFNLKKVDMAFFKKYWWVFAILAAVIVYLVWINRKKTTVLPGATKPNGNGCTTTVADGDAKVAAWESIIDNDSDWKSQVQNQATAEGTSYENALKRNAEYMLENSDKVCRPTGA